MATSNRHFLWLGLLLVTVVALAGCAAGSSPQAESALAAASTPMPSMMTAPTISPGMAQMMAALPDEDVPAATVSQGNQPLPYREEDGVKVFEITAQDDD